MSQLSLSDKTAFLILQNLFKYLVGFLVPIFLVRFLSQRDFGTYQQVLLIEKAVSNVFLMGIPASIFYFLGILDEARKRIFLAQTRGLLILCGGGGALLTYIAAPGLGNYFDNPQTAPLLRLYALYLFFFLAGEYLSPLLLMANRVKLLAALSSLEIVVRIVFIFTPLAFGLGLRGIIAGAGLYAFTRFIVYRLLAQRTMPTERFRLDRSLATEQIRYGFPPALNGAAGIAAQLLDKFIVALYFNPAQFAVYAVGALEIPLDVIVQASVASILRARLPALIQAGNLPEIIRIWREAVRKQALIILPVFFFLMITAETVIPLFFTEEYRESTEIFRIYLLLLPIQIVCVSLFPQSLGKTTATLYVTLASLAVNLTLTVTLRDLIGLRGPAAAAVLSMVTATGIYLIVSLRLLQTTMRRFFPFRTCLGITVCCLLASVPVLWTNNLGASPFLRLLTGGVLFSAIYALAIRKAGFLTENDARLLKRWLRLHPVLERESRP